MKRLAVAISVLAVSVSAWTTAGRPGSPERTGERQSPQTGLEAPRTIVCAHNSRALVSLG